MYKEKKKSIINVLKEALKHETQAFNYYYKASKKVAFPETESLLIQLAEEERKHRLFIIEELNRIDGLMSQKTDDSFDADRDVQYPLSANITLKRLPTSPGVDFAALSLPAEFLGGDYIDTITLNRGEQPPALGVLLYDVMGHGLEATQLKALAKKTFGLLRETWAQGQSLTDFNRPEQVITNLNRKLINECQNCNRFVSAFYGVLDTEEKTLTYTSAGHEPPILVKANGEYIHLRETELLLGIDENLVYSGVSIPIDVGDVLVLYSDGITEACNSQDEMFERERLRKVIQKGQRGSASEIMQQIINVLHDFLDGESMTDEFTLAVMKVNAV